MLLTTLALIMILTAAGATGKDELEVLVTYSKQIMLNRGKSAIVKSTQVSNLASQWRLDSGSSEPCLVILFGMGKEEGNRLVQVHVCEVTKFEL